MYTILMNDDKSLFATVRKTIYQGENLADKIQFLCPESYDGFSLKKCKVFLKYIDQGNVPHCETLFVQDEVYKGKIKCVLPINTELTKFAGTIRVSLSFVFEDEEIQSKYVLHSGETSIRVNPMDVKFQMSNAGDNGGSDSSGGGSFADDEFKAVEF